MGFEDSKIKMYRLPEDYKEALSYGSKSGNISAFFDVVPYSKLFLSKYCDKYTIVGPTFRTDGFVFVFPKGSPLVADVSRAIIKLTENAEILDIQREWSVSDLTCNGPDSIVTSVSVSLQTFKGLFAITGAITFSCVLIFIVSYVYKNRCSLQQILNSTNTFWSKIKEIGRHCDQRDFSSHPSIIARDPHFRYPKPLTKDSDTGRRVVTMGMRCSVAKSNGSGMRARHGTVRNRCARRWHRIGRSGGKTDVSVGTGWSKAERARGYGIASAEQV
ncbi:hypothetical protein RND71_016960 [Anisodus tanguticus]|uniref:Ionotropic glutamate receptor C-terminal domain-containing protein n=1 Tax=Anisodus tanguticus TaxID=243964 RepID=A0AAE1VHS8_9SOLA|nr:hypothetical protein RND71_016960 [Anisodus tanguticus]